MITTTVVAFWTGAAVGGLVMFGLGVGATVAVIAYTTRRPVALPGADRL